MTGTATQRHQAMQAALYAVKPRARLVHLRLSGRLLLVALARPDGTVTMIRATTADHPELDALPAHERSRVRSAFLALAQCGGGENAAA